MNNVEIRYKHSLCTGFLPTSTIRKVYTSFLLTDYNLQATHQYHISNDSINTDTHPLREFRDTDMARPDIIIRALLGLGYKKV